MCSIMVIAVLLHWKPFWNWWLFPFFIWLEIRSSFLCEHGNHYVRVHYVGSYIYGHLSSKLDTSLLALYQIANRNGHPSEILLSRVVDQSWRRSLVCGPNLFLLPHNNSTPTLAVCRVVIFIFDDTFSQTKFTWCSHFYSRVIGKKCTMTLQAGV